MRDAAHRRFVASLPCARCWQKPSDCAHISTATAGGTATKATDKNCIPLCRACHARSHGIGDKVFYKCKDTAVKMAKELYAATRNREKALQILKAYIVRVFA